MPELPEVETNRRELSNHLRGKHISGITVLSAKQFIGDPETCIGARVEDILRHGKIMAIRLSNGIFINIHLKMTGQMLYAGDGANAVFRYTIPLAGTNRMPGKSTRIILSFDDGSSVFFNDSRRFGWMKLTKAQEKPYAVDVTEPGFTPEYFAGMLRKTSRPVKTVLLDQMVVSGIGNIYANESLFEARLSPTRPANLLSRRESGALYHAVKKIIEEGIRYKGSSGKDESYLLPDGSRGGYQARFRVYQREGQPCIRCSSPIKRSVLGGRSSFACPACQR